MNYTPPDPMSYAPPEPWSGVGVQVNGLAPRTVRLAAALLDGLLYAFFPLVALAALMRAGPGALYVGSPGDAGGLGLLLLLSALGSFVLTVYQWVLLSTRGQTIGKRVFGIRIYRLDDSPAGFINALLLRVWVFGLLSGVVGAVLGRFFLGAGLLLYLLDILPILGGDRRCLHDLLARTEVRWAEPTPRVSVPALAVLGLAGLGALGFFVHAGVQIGRTAVDRGIIAPGKPLTPENVAEVLAGRRLGPGGEPLDVLARKVRAEAAAAKLPGVAKTGGTASAGSVGLPEQVPGIEVLPSGGAPARILRYLDEHGVVHFTDDPDSIPARYREAATEVD